MAKATISNNVISVITPSYNQGEFISDTIRSVLSQKGEFYIDYIIMDGGSTDDSVSVIKSYESLLKNDSDTFISGGLTYHVSRDPNASLNRCLGISYRWTSEKDRGQSHAINKGLAVSKGDIITWLNSDDRYTQDVVYGGIFQEFMKYQNRFVFFGGAIAVDENNNELWRHLPGQVTLYSLLYREGVAQPSIFFRRDVVNSVGLLNEELHYFMDYDYWFRFLFAGYRFYGIDQFIAVQKYHGKSKSNECGKLFEAFYPEANKWKDYYKKKLLHDNPGRYLYYYCKSVLWELLVILRLKK